MNIHNNENDPFEDVFRDRFADFESEPDTQLWQKIEPKLPVDATRKFPYWQTSAVVILLLLAGLWTYHKEYSGEIIIKSDDNPQKISLKNSLIVNGLEKKATNDINVKNSELHPTWINFLKVKPTIELFREVELTQLDNFIYASSKRKVTSKKLLSSELSIRIQEAKENPSLFSKSNTTIETSITSLTKTEENKVLNTNNPLNLLSVNNSNEKQEIITQNSSNSQSILTVFSNKENVSVLSKNYLITLDSKNYSLLSNHFKTPGIKFVIAPKKDDYFKERKPLEIYASVMPLLNYYTITPNGNDANYVHSISVNNEDNRLGFYTQAGLVFTLSERFKLRTGLTFTRTNHSINYQIRTDSLIIQPSDKQGVDVSFEEKKVNYSQVANYLGTKIEVQYIFLEGEALSHYLNVGLEGAYRLNGVKQFNGFANFAYGVTRQIGDSAYLFIEPTFSYSLNQQSDNSAFLLVKPNKIGFNIGVNFKIK